MKINYKTVKQFVVLSILMKSVVACSSDDLFQGEGTPTAITKGNLDTPGVSEIYTDSTKNGAIVLSSAPVGNPYNVDTLKKAYALLYPTGRGRSATPAFTPTHYQVRFLPADSLEFEELKNGELISTPVPLDKKVNGEGTHYFDPVLAAQGVPYTWQYTIVPASQPLPNIRHEITAEICAPNDGSRGRSVDGLSDVWPALEAKAYEMCGEEAPSRIQSRGPGDIGMPGGPMGTSVLVWDDIAQRYIPAKGAKLVFWNNTGVTDILVDEKGHYVYSGEYNRVELHWNSLKKWVICDDNESLSAVYVLPQTGKRISTVYIKGGKQETFAHITRALHRFYNEYNQGLPVPLSGLISRLSVLCVDDWDRVNGHAGLYSPPRKITVWSQGLGGGYLAGFSIFETMVHELGHSIHYRNIILHTRNWNDTEKILKESWARYVEWLVMEYEYNELSRILNLAKTLTFKTKETLPYWLPGGAPGQPFTKIYTEYDYGYQYWPFGGTEPGAKTVSKLYLPYSPIFIDLVDDENQQNYYRSVGMRDGWGSSSYKYYPDDQVSGYTVGQLMGALRYSESLPEFRDHIKNSRPHTEAEKAKVDALFTSFINLWNGYK